MLRDKNLSNVSLVFPYSSLAYLFHSEGALLLHSEKITPSLFFSKRHERKREILGDQRWNSDIMERCECCFSWGGSLPVGETVSRKSEKSNVCPQRWSNRFQNLLTEKYIFFSCSKRNCVYLLTPILSFKCLPLPSH